MYLFYFFYVFSCFVLLICSLIFLCQRVLCYSSCLSLPSVSAFICFNLVFGQKFCKTIDWRPLLWGWPSLWEILDPPLLCKIKLSLECMPWQLAETVLDLHNFLKKYNSRCLLTVILCETEQHTIFFSF